jgi:serine/threonine protein kinase
MNDLTNGQLGKYQLRRLLGKGASGTVYLGVDTFSKAVVAVKVIDSRVFEDPEHGEIHRQQFLNEASLAGKLEHPHIVSILDAVVTGKPSYVAMEYVAGGNLTQLLGAKPVPVEDAIQIGFKCCGALDYAFKQGIVHRDIKPANIMVAQGTDVKIADFGAAYLKSSAPTETVNIGSPAYMSPEQIEGGELSLQSDMFSLGIVLYELLTGRRPFVAPDVPALLQQVLKAEPAAPSKTRPDIPPELDKAVLAALRKNPRDRYPTWAHFALELAKLGGLRFQGPLVPDSERFASLRQSEMLDKLDDAQMWQLVKAGRWKRLAPRTVLIREGEGGNSLFFLAKGQLKVTKQGRLLNMIGAGECFGEMSYIRGDTRQATVESLTEVVLAEVDQAALERLSVECQLHFTRAVLRTVVDRLAFADTRVTQPSQ